MDRPLPQIFMWDTKGNFPSYGYRLRNCICHMEEYPTTGPSHIKSSCGTQNKISKPMGRVRGMDYVPWRNIQKWIPVTPNLHVEHTMKFPMPCA